jgi:hypothetical protein
MKQNTHYSDEPQITALFALVLADRQACYRPLDDTRDHLPTIARWTVPLVNRREAKDFRAINVLQGLDPSMPPISAWLGAPRHYEWA